MVPPSPPWAITRGTTASPFFLARTLAAAARPVPTAAELPNREWIHGNLQADSGYGVENTSRQPVALATIN